MLQWHKCARFKGKQWDQLTLAAYALGHRLSQIPSLQRLLLHESAKRKEQRGQLGSMVQNALIVRLKLYTVGLGRYTPNQQRRFIKGHTTKATEMAVIAQENSNQVIKQSRTLDRP